MKVSSLLRRYFLLKKEKEMNGKEKEMNGIGKENKSKQKKKEEKLGFCTIHSFFFLL